MQVPKELMDKLEDLLTRGNHMYVPVGSVGEKHFTLYYAQDGQSDDEGKMYIITVEAV